MYSKHWFMVLSAHFFWIFKFDVSEFVVLVTVSIKNTAFWDVTPCLVAGYQ